MNNWTIGKKLTASFLAVAAITLLLGIVGYYGAVKSNEAIDEIGIVRLPSVQSLLVMSEAQTAVDGVENALLSRDINLKSRQDKYADLAAAWKRANDAWKTYEALPQAPEEKITWNKFVPAWESWKKDHQAYVALSQEYDKTVDAQLKGVELYAKMAKQALTINPVPFAKAKALLAQIVEIYRSKTDSEKSTYTKVDLLSVYALLSIMEAQTGIDASENALLDRSSSVEERKASYERITAAWQRVAAARKVYEPLEQTPQEAKLWSQFVPAWEQWKAEHEAFLVLSKAYDSTVDDILRSNEVYKKMTERALVTNAVTFGAADTLLNKLVEINQTLAADSTKASISLSATLKFLSLTAMIVGVVTALLLGYFITRSLVKILSGTAESLSEGSDQVASASGQISSASQSLAEGASEQAASLEETSASLEEIASMTKRNAENALSAKDLSSETRQAAETGSANMQEMNHAMADIQSASGNIAKIIKTIDEIAFQTNILALNAAVEAARAGEAGAGFAVVADEVRNLAQRSAQAAKETAEKIEDSIAKSASGVAISGKVTESLTQIVTKARQVDELVAEIATASREQSQGIDQVNMAVTQMDKVTQTNAAAAEESASASEELTAQAATLRELVADLQKLVTGSEHAGHTASPREVLHTRPYRTPRTAVPARAATRPAIGGARPALGSSKKNNPESEIPLEEGFKDF